MGPLSCAWPTTLATRHGLALAYSLLEREVVRAALNADKRPLHSTMHDLNRPSGYDSIARGCPSGKRRIDADVRSWVADRKGLRCLQCDYLALRAKQLLTLKGLM